jgi:hypothetical protein
VWNYGWGNIYPVCKLFDIMDSKTIECDIDNTIRTMKSLVKDKSFRDLVVDSKAPEKQEFIADLKRHMNHLDELAAIIDNFKKKRDEERKIEEAKKEFQEQSQRRDMENRVEQKKRLEESIKQMEETEKEKKRIKEGKANARKAKRTNV